MPPTEEDTPLKRRLKAEERLQGLSPREVLAALAHRLSLDALRSLLQTILTDGPL